MGVFMSFRMAGLALLTLLAVAFATGTALHAAPNLNEARLEAYQLAGGSLDDLCGEDGADHAHIASCSLCHLVSSSDLPQTVHSLTLIERRLVATVILPQLRRAAARPRDPATPPRGPPQA